MNLSQYAQKIIALILCVWFSFIFQTRFAHGIEFTSSPESYPHGLASDGVTIWQADYDADLIYSLDSTGKIIGSFAFPHGHPRGLAYDSGQLYVATGNHIYVVNSSTGADIVNFASPDTSSPNHQGLAYGNGMLWIASRDDPDDRIYSVNPSTGAPISDFAAPGSNPRGLTYHAGSLWNLDSSDDKLHEIDPNTGSVLNSYPAPLGNPRGLAFFNGKFIQADNKVDVLIGFDLSNTFADVFIAPDQLSITGSPGAMFLPVISSHALNQTNAKIRRILIFQHGVDDNAVEYFARAWHAAELAGKLEETLIVSLQLLDNGKLTSAPPTQFVYWVSDRFWGGLSAGATASYPRTERFDAYTLLDQLLNDLTSTSSQFTNLEEIIVSGHSGGGQFVNRYAVFNVFENTLSSDPREVLSHYIVMNPSSYVYLDDKRYDPSTLDLTNGIVDFITPPPTAGYDDYGYGVQSLFDYAATTGISAAMTQYPDRRIIILLGEIDTGNGSLDVSAPAMLQGANRFDRGRIYHRHLQEVYGAANVRRQRLATVPSVDHDSFDMITSANGLRFHFQGRMKITDFTLAGNSATLEWEGGNGFGDVQVSSDLSSWLPIALDAASPFTDTSANPTINTKRFYQISEPN